MQIAGGMGVVGVENFGPLLRGGLSVYEVI